MNPQYKDAFIQGFGSVFRQWTALELAVHNCWGGPQSAEKANNLMNEVLELFNNPKTIYKDEISMLIEDYVDQEFSMVCEDGSPDEIGEILVHMWRECSEGNFNLVQTIIGKERDRQLQNPLNRSQGLEGGDVIDENDDDEDNNGNSNNNNNSIDMSEIEEQQQQEQEEQQYVRQGPIIDEDGFETVVRGKKTRKNKK